MTGLPNLPSTLSEFHDIKWLDPNISNLVRQVSKNSPIDFYPTKSIDCGIKVLALDVGLKSNQIRCFLNRGVTVRQVPFDWDIVHELEHGALKDGSIGFDGLFIVCI